MFIVINVLEISRAFISIYHQYDNMSQNIYGELKTIPRKINISALLNILILGSSVILYRGRISRAVTAIIFDIE